MFDFQKLEVHKKAKLLHMDCKKIIRKIKQINEKVVKQCDNDEYEDHHSNVEAITDFTDDARTTSEKSPNLQKKRSQFTPKFNKNDF
jgi:uncharacterized coiled-coil DUF342 family protein